MSADAWDWQPASRPPNGERAVVVQMQYGGVELGYHRRGKWHLVTGRPVNVTHWAERPGYIHPTVKAAPKRARKGARWTPPQS